jgi:hypothetical protein
MVIKKIGDLIFVPTGTWANALRARTIVERDLKAGHLDSELSLYYCNMAELYKFVDIRKWKRWNYQH